MIYYIEPNPLIYVFHYLTPQHCYHNIKNIGCTSILSLGGVVHVELLYQSRVDQ